MIGALILTVALSAPVSIPDPCFDGDAPGIVIYDGTCVTEAVYDSWYPNAGLEFAVNDAATRPSHRLTGIDIGGYGHRFVDTVVRLHTPRAI